MVWLLDGASPRVHTLAGTEEMACLQRAAIDAGVELCELVSGDAGSCVDAVAGVSRLDCDGGRACGGSSLACHACGIDW